MTQHVYPDNDSSEHDTGGAPCPCMPRTVDGIVVHNSFDGREAGTVIRDALDGMYRALEKYPVALADKYRHARLLTLVHFPREDGDPR